MDERQFREFNAFARIQKIETNGRTEVLVDGQKYMEWDTGDEVSYRIGVIQLYQSGKGSQEEIAKAFGIHVNSVYNYLKIYKEEGGKGLIKKETQVEPWKITPEMKFKILEIAFRNRDLSFEEMVKQLEKQWDQKVSRNSLRRVLIENGFIKKELRRDDLEDGEDLFSRMRVEEELKWDAKEVEDRQVKSVPALDGEGNVKGRMGEKGKRHYSPGQRDYLEQLKEAASEGYRIERGDYNAYGGGLLFVPLLERYNFIEMIKQ